MSARHRASADIDVEPANGDRRRLARLRCEPPLTFRRTGSRLTWVGTAAGPLGGDQLDLRVRVGAGGELDLRSVAAAVVLPGSHGEPSSLDVVVDVGEGASLTWWPEPTIITTRADHRQTTQLRIGHGADVVVVDELVLGRHGERPGRIRSRLVVDGPDGPVARTGLDVGAAGWDGPAVVGQNRLVAQVFVSGPRRDRLFEGVASIGPVQGVSSGVSEGRHGTGIWNVVSREVAPGRSLVAQVIGALTSSRVAG